MDVINENIRSEILWHTSIKIFTYFNIINGSVVCIIGEEFLIEFSGTYNKGIIVSVLSGEIKQFKHFPLWRNIFSYNLLHSFTLRFEVFFRVKL